MSQRGTEHPSTLTSMDNLALVLSRQGKYEQAEEMHRQALGLRETVLGKEHPDTLESSVSHLLEQTSIDLLAEPQMGFHLRTSSTRKSGQRNKFGWPSPGRVHWPPWSLCFLWAALELSSITWDSGIITHLPYLRQLIRGFNEFKVRTLRIHLVWQLAHIGK